MIINLEKLVLVHQKDSVTKVDATIGNISMASPYAANPNNQLIMMNNSGKKKDSGASIMRNRFRNSHDR